MKALANRLAMQHLVNAYAHEPSNGVLLEKQQQNLSQLRFSQGLTLLSISLDAIQAKLLIPLFDDSLLGRYRLNIAAALHAYVTLAYTNALQWAVQRWICRI